MAQRFGRTLICERDGEIQTGIQQIRLEAQCFAKLCCRFRNPALASENHAMQQLGLSKVRSQPHGFA